MQSIDIQSSISQKDCLLFTKTYRKVSQLFYQNQKDQNIIQDIINLTVIIKQIIKNKEQSKHLNILSQMEILKAKAKGQTQLIQKITQAIQHLRMPKNIQIQAQLLYDIMDSPQLFSLGSLIFIRLFKILKHQAKYDQKEVIQIIAARMTIDPELSLEICYLISANNEQISKKMIKEGIIKYFICNYMPMVINQDKLLLYKCIKFLKIIANSQKGILKERQTILSKIIILYEQYIVVISQILSKCYEQAYCCQFANNQIKKNQDGIDFYYLWSYNQYFCVQLLSDKFIDELIDVMKNQNMSQYGDTESKYYAIIGNYCKFCKYYNYQIIKQLPRHQSSLHNYFKICLDFVYHDKNSLNNLQWGKIQALLEQNTSGPTHQLYKMIKQAIGKETKVNSLSHKYKATFNSQKNADLLHIKAGRIPKTDLQLKEHIQILFQKEGKSDFDKDSLLFVKQKALQSIRKSILQNNSLSLKDILQRWQCTSIELLKKFLQIIQLNLMMNESSIKGINISKLLQLILWLQNNNDGEIIDWGCIGQILNIIVQQSQIIKNIKDIPQKNFWILGLQNLQEENHYKNICLAIENSKNKSMKKINIALGFVGKKIDNTRKIQFLKKYKVIFENIIRDIKEDRDYKINLMMMSYFIKNWYDQIPENNKNNKQFQNILIKPLVEVVISKYKALPQQHCFLEACLPYKIDFGLLTQNVQQLVNSHGVLAAQVYDYQLKNKKNILNSDKITPLSHQQNPKNLLQVLNFYDIHPQLLNSAQFNKLIYKIKQNKDIFWHQYPFYFDIMSLLINLLKSGNPAMKPYNSQHIITLISQIENNSDISKQQREDLFYALKQVLQQFSKKGYYLQISQLKTSVNTILQQQIQQQMIYILNNYKIRQQKSIKRQPDKSLNSKPEIKVQHLLKQRIQKLQGQIKKKQNKKLQLNITTNESCQSQIKNTYMKINIKKPQILLADLDKKQSQIHNKNGQIKQNDVQLSNQVKLVHYEDSFLKKEEESKQQLVVVKNVMSIQDQFQSIKPNIHSRDYLSALQTLRKIVNQQLPVITFNDIYTVLSSQIGSQAERQLLGELLSQYYPMILDDRALNLLLDKERTSLNSEIFYEMVRKYIKAFRLVRRWLLVSRQGLNIAMKRIKEGFLCDACNVAAYNLTKSIQIQFFYSQKYHLILQSQLQNIKTTEEYVSYAYLVGKVCQLPQIKNQFIKSQLYYKIMRLLTKFKDNSRAISNLCYVQSIFLEENMQVNKQIISLQEQNKIIYTCLTNQVNNKSLVQVGSCYIANLSYGDDLSKQILRKRKTIQLLLLLFKGNISSQDHQIYKQLLRGMGNLSMNKLCSLELIEGQFCELANQMAENLNFFAFYDQKKARIMKLLIDIINNIAFHKTKLQIIFKSKIPLLIITMLETTEKNSHILCGCIDTIDSLCQDNSIQQYFIKDKKLPYILNDFLKMQEQQLILIKTIRLISNLTIPHQNIQPLLKSNLFSVLGNIVMPNIALSLLDMQEDNIIRIQGYILKMVIRIFQVAPNVQHILKSGYLDCLVRCIEIFHTEETLINIFFYYSYYLPNVLNKRAFSCLIKIMIVKINTMTDVDKCIISFKHLITFSYDKENQEEIFHQIPQMYQKFLQSNYLADALFLLVYHLLRSSNLRMQLLKKQSKVLQKVQQYCREEPYIQIGKVIMFLCYNNNRQIFFSTALKGFLTDQDLYNTIKKGIRCKLYRNDGSHKQAIIDIDDDFKIRAYKFPDGQVKKKYMFELNQLKDYQFDFNNNEDLWSRSIFSIQSRSLFNGHIADRKFCATLVGLIKWGQVYLINLQFESETDKIIFYHCLKYLLSIFRA